MVGVSAESGRGLVDDLARQPEAQAGGEVGFDQRKPQVVEPGSVRKDPRVVSDSRENITAEASEGCCAQRASLAIITDVVEAPSGDCVGRHRVRIDGGGVHCESVAAFAGLDQVWIVERASEPGDFGLQGIALGPGGIVGPEVIEQDIGADDLTGRQRQAHQELGALSCGHAHDACANPHVDLPQQREHEHRPSVRNLSEVARAQLSAFAPDATHATMRLSGKSTRWSRASASTSSWSPSRCATAIATVWRSQRVLARPAARSAHSNRPSSNPASTTIRGLGDDSADSRTSSTVVRSPPIARRIRASISSSVMGEPWPASLTLR